MKRSTRERHSAPWGRAVLIGMALIMGTSAPAWADVYAFRDDSGALYYTNLPGPGRHKVKLPLRETPLKKGRVMHVAASGARETAFEPYIASAATLFSVDPCLIRAIIRAESNFNPQAVSPKGAQGLMQLMPGTARDMGVLDPFDPGENIHGGVRYFRQLLETLNGSLPLALAAYNAGPMRVIGRDRIPDIPETRNYVERVLTHYETLKPLSPGALSN